MHDAIAKEASSGGTEATNSRGDEATFLGGTPTTEERPTMDDAIEIEDEAEMLEAELDSRCPSQKMPLTKTKALEDAY